MAGGLMQLVAYGAQDVYLTGNPQITLFKVVYRRHTNFSMECIELPIDVARPSGTTTIQILRNGDLATKSYLKIILPDLNPTNNNWGGTVAWVKRLGHAIVKSAEITIGGSLIDKQWGQWLDIWYELTHTLDQERGYKNMIGDIPELTTLQTTIPANGLNLFVPFQFWFCTNYGLALPLIALQYHEIRLNIDFQDMANLIVYTKGTSNAAPTFGALTFNAAILVDYIYLDSEERRRFAQVGHEYLIEQLQYNGNNLQNVQLGSTNQQTTLNFNHPCKELIWTHQLGAFNGANNASFLGYTASDDPDDWDIVINDSAMRLIHGSLSISTISFTGNNSVNATIPASGTVNLISNNVTGILMTIQLHNSTVSSKTVYFSPTTFIFNDPITLGNTFNPMTKISNASIDWDGTSFVVTSVIHTLTLEDISIPINTASGVGGATDNRLNNSAQNDVYVIQPTNYGSRLDGSGNIVVNGNMVLNGHDRFMTREGNYFNYVQTAQHHTRTPADGINVYSFALHPEQHQPTGTCNMSRIDTARLFYTISDPFSNLREIGFDIFTGTLVYIYVKNYNILRVMSGMGGLAYNH